jgi:hypothetical protein
MLGYRNDGEMGFGKIKNDELVKSQNYEPRNFFVIFVPFCGHIKYRVSNKFAALVPKLQSRFTLNSAIPPGKFLRESYLKQNYNNMSNTYVHRF